MGSLDISFFGGVKRGYYENVSPALTPAKMTRIVFVSLPDVSYDNVSFFVFAVFAVLAVFPSLRKCLVLFLSSLFAVRCSLLIILSIILS